MTNKPQHKAHHDTPVDEVDASSAVLDRAHFFLIASPSGPAKGIMASGKHQEPMTIVHGP